MEPERLHYTVFDCECQVEILPIDKDGWILPEEKEQLTEFLDSLGGGCYMIYARPAFMRIQKVTPQPNFSLLLVEKEGYDTHT